MIGASRIFLSVVGGRFQESQGIRDGGGGGCGTRERDTKNTESVVEIPERKSHLVDLDVDGR